jgi:hypothetical protein
VLVKRIQSVDGVQPIQEDFTRDSGAGAWRRAGGRARGGTRGEALKPLVPLVAIVIHPSPWVPLPHPLPLGLGVDNILALIPVGVRRVVAARVEAGVGLGENARGGGEGVEGGLLRSRGGARKG